MKSRNEFNKMGSENFKLSTNSYANISLTNSYVILNLNDG